MRRALTAVTMAMLAATWAAAAPSGAATVGSLLGRDPAGVRAALADVPADWPIQPALSLSTKPGERIELIRLSTLFADRRMQDWIARFQAGQQAGPAPAYVACAARLDPIRAPDQGAGELWLMFRDGRLDTVFEIGPPTERDHPPPIHTYGPGENNMKLFEENSRLPIATPYPARLGDLPLADGLGFMARWRRVPVPAEATLAVDCLPHQAARPVTAPTRQKLSDYNMQGLIGLPFVPAMPFINGHRKAAAERGAAALSALKLGEPVPGGIEGFAKANGGVRVLRGDKAGYAILTINLGAPSGNRLDNTDGMAMAGVQDGRVVWIAPDAAAIAGSAVLCLDEKGVRTTARPGCKGFPARYVP